jgi:hypothetical protein
VAVRKAIFRWQLVASHEVAGLPKVGRVPHHPPNKGSASRRAFCLVEVNSSCFNIPKQQIMKLQLKPILPSAIELFTSAFLTFGIVLLANSRQLLSYYGLQSSDQLIKSNAGNAISQALRAIDSLTATDGVVTFLIWAIVGVLCFAIVEALGHAYKEIEFENELSSTKYVHPATFTKAKFWKSVVFNFVVLTVALALFLSVGLAFLLLILPVGLVYSRVFLFSPSLVNALYMALGLAVVFVGLVAVNVVGRVLIFRRKLASAN